MTRPEFDLAFARNAGTPAHKQVRKHIEPTTHNLLSTSSPMSAHAIKLARWSLWFWHDYLLIMFCKLRGVGLAARQGLLAACLPTKLAHKASKNNFIDKSSSEGRGRAKQKSVDGLTSSCPNIHTCSEVTNAHTSRMESFGTFSPRTQGLNPAAFLISSKLSSLNPHICVLPLPL